PARVDLRALGRRLVLARGAWRLSGTSRPSPEHARLLPALPAGHVGPDARVRYLGGVRRRAYLRRRRTRRHGAGAAACHGLVGRAERSPRDAPVLPLPRLGGVLDGLLRGPPDPAGGRLHTRARAAP